MPGHYEWSRPVPVWGTPTASAPFGRSSVSDRERLVWFFRELLDPLCQKAAVHGDGFSGYKG